MGIMLSAEGQTPPPVDASYGRQSLSNLLWIRNALIERYELLGREYDTNQMRTLAQLKERCREIVTDFVDTNRANAAGRFDDYFLMTGADMLPMCTATGLCWTFCLPTNYLEYTPAVYLSREELMIHKTNYLALAGFPDAAFNDDFWWETGERYETVDGNGVVGYGYEAEDVWTVRHVNHPGVWYYAVGGVENPWYYRTGEFALPECPTGWVPVTSAVVAVERMEMMELFGGGDHYPPGRTMWNTTDYGWEGLAKIVQTLRWTTGPVVWTNSDGLMREENVTSMLGRGPEFAEVYWEDLGNGGMPSSRVHRNFKGLMCHPDWPESLAGENCSDFTLLCEWELGAGAVPVYRSQPFYSVIFDGDISYLGRVEYAQPIYWSPTPGGYTVTENGYVIYAETGDWGAHGYLSPNGYSMSNSECVVSNGMHLAWSGTDRTNVQCQIDWYVKEQATNWVTCVSNWSFVPSNAGCYFRLGAGHTVESNSWISFRMNPWGMPKPFATNGSVGQWSIGECIGTNGCSSACIHRGAWERGGIGWNVTQVWLQISATQYTSNYVSQHEIVTSRWDQVGSTISNWLENGTNFIAHFEIFSNLTACLTNSFATNYVYYQAGYTDPVFTVEDGLTITTNLQYYYPSNPPWGVTNTVVMGTTCEFWSVVWPGYDGMSTSPPSADQGYDVQVICEVNSPWDQNHHVDYLERNFSPPLPYNWYMCFESGKSCQYSQYSEFKLEAGPPVIKWDVPYGLRYGEPP